MKDAHSDESNEKSYFRFIFSSYDRFGTENSAKIANFEYKNNDISKTKNCKILNIDFLLISVHSASFM